MRRNRHWPGHVATATLRGPSQAGKTQPFAPCSERNSWLLFITNKNPKFSTLTKNVLSPSSGLRVSYGRKIQCPHSIEMRKRGPQTPRLSGWPEARTTTSPGSRPLSISQDLASGECALPDTPRQITSPGSPTPLPKSTGHMPSGSSHKTSLEKEVSISQRLRITD